MTRLFWTSLLAAFLLWPFVRWDLPRYQFNSARADAVRLAMDVEAFRFDCGRLPHSLDELLGTWSTPTCGPRPWSRPDDLRDVYGNKIHYWTSADGGSYEVRVLGRDRVYASADDVVADGWEWPWSSSPPSWERLRNWLLFPALLLCAAVSGLVLLYRGLSRLWRAVQPAAPGRRDTVRSTIRGVLAVFWLFALVVLLMPGGCRRCYECQAEFQLNHIAGALEDLRRRCGVLPFALDQPPLPPVCGADAPTRESERVDPWGNAIAYARQPFNPGYLLYSPGADRVAGTPDDIVQGDARRPWARSYHDPLQQLTPLHLLAGIALLMFLADAAVAPGLALWRRRRH